MGPQTVPESMRQLVQRKSESRPSGGASAFVSLALHLSRGSLVGCKGTPVSFIFKEEGRGTRNGYEASKGSKGISGL